MREREGGGGAQPLENEREREEGLSHRKVREKRGSATGKCEREEGLSHRKVRENIGACCGMCARVYVCACVRSCACARACVCVYDFE